MSRAVLRATLAFLALLTLEAAEVRGEGLDWPEATRETRPWTRWWWMGSAVDERGLSLALEDYRRAGLGGVEITPIYGVRGEEARALSYLSPEWMRRLDHVLAEARRLDLGVDMATGTGWPFGGPWVGTGDACRTLAYRTWTLRAGQRLEEPVQLRQEPLVRALRNQVYEAAGLYRPEGEPARARPHEPVLRPRVTPLRIGDLVAPVEANPDLQALALEQVKYPVELPLVALVAHPEGGGAPILLDGRVDEAGRLDWSAPEGGATLHGVFLGWHGKLVERAAPGGEGNVIDHFATGPIRSYLARFDRAFAGHELAGLRSFFNDSYEVDDATGQADGTPALFAEFQRRRGYDLRHHLPALFARAGSDESARVLADYRETVSDLLLDTFTAEWAGWARGRGAIVRHQAHGSPGSLLDLYAASDIPETEGQDLMRAKWATSAAHVGGRRLVSAEAATWLGEHFRSTLDEVRRHVDRFFLAGVNHVVWHGTAFSPPEAAWPGWLFYAAVHFSPANPWWSDFEALNRYVTRVQSFLQTGRPDADILLYYPLYDALAKPGEGLLRHFGADRSAPEGTAFEAAADRMQARGYAFDFVSDRQIAGLRAQGGRLAAGGSSYAALVVPESQFVPLETFERVLGLARAGATVIVFRDLPADVSGWHRLAERRQAYRGLVDGLRFDLAGAVREARLGAGRVLLGRDLDALLNHAGIVREPLVDHGLSFARRRDGDGRTYFLVNTGERAFQGPLPLSAPAASAAVFDPRDGRFGTTELRTRAGAAGTEAYLQLAPGQSAIVRTSPQAATGPRFPYLEAAGEAVALAGPWTLRLVEGGPEPPPDATLDVLRSWTELPGEAVRRFSGTGRYEISFPRPPGSAVAHRLDLGRVHESARVSLNGREVAVLMGPPYTLDLPAEVLTASNRLEVRVTNLMANRIADLDRRGVVWKRFKNVNFPARLPANRGGDGLFTAAAWEPLPSGLLGPVTLTPLRPLPGGTLRR